MLKNYASLASCKRGSEQESIRIRLSTPTPVPPYDPHLGGSAYRRYTTKCREADITGLILRLFE